MKSSQESVRHGEQKPRKRHIDGAVEGTEGTDCSALLADLGTDLFPWQQGIINDWCAYDKNKNLSYITCGLDVPRQNGKNKIIEALEVWRLAVCGWHILHTAHRVKTTKKSFYRLLKFFTDTHHTEMCELVEKVRKTNGEEAIFLTNGGSIEFISRTNGAARGFDDIQLVIYDEAQELTDSQYDSISYALSASSTGERQTVYTGTPPNNTNGGEVFTRYFNSAMAGTSKKTCWSSWAAPATPMNNATFDDIIDEVYLSNPSMGYVLDIDYTRSEFEGGNRLGFAHERLGWWQSTSGVKLFNKKKWVELGYNDAKETPKDGKMAVGVKFSVDGATASLCVALKPKEGLPYVEAIYHKSLNCGVSWISDFLLQRKNKIACVAIDGRSNTDTLISLLRDGGFPPKGIILAGTKGAIASATRFYNAYQESKITHFNQDGLNTAIGATMKRNIGTDGGWGFQGIADADVTLVDACALAYWGVMTTKRNPARKAKVF